MDFIVFAAVVIGAAFLIHKTGRGTGNVRTIAGYIVAGVMAAVAAFGDVVLPLLNGLF